MNTKHLVQTKSRSYRFNPLVYFGLMIFSLFVVLMLTNAGQHGAGSAASVKPAAEPIHEGQIRPGQTLFKGANTKEIKCDIDAYVFDIYPNGINVRSNAIKGDNILGQIKPDENGVTVHVIGSNGIWLKIENAERIEGESPFSGSGWVYSSQLAIYTATDTKLYSRPKTKSKVLAKLPGDVETTLVACKGRWAKVRYGKNQGWLEPDAQCASPVTSCS